MLEGEWPAIKVLWNMNGVPFTTYRNDGSGDPPVLSHFHMCPVNLSRAHRRFRNTGLSLCWDLSKAFFFRARI